MKNPDRNKVSRLDALPNIGKAIAADLNLIGIDHPKKLIGMEPFKMYENLCARTGKRHDPCVIDVFMSAVHFMEGGEPLPWWSFTGKRKKHMSFLDSKYRSVGIVGLDTLIDHNAIIDVGNKKLCLQK